MQSSGARSVSSMRSARAVSSKTDGAAGEGSVVGRGAGGLAAAAAPGPNDSAVVGETCGLGASGAAVPGRSLEGSIVRGGGALEVADVVDQYACPDVAAGCEACQPSAIKRLERKPRPRSPSRTRPDRGPRGRDEAWLSVLRREPAYVVYRLGAGEEGRLQVAVDV